eukprot:gnl/TRDRNA2_/TRDRNA2_160012_c1_seq1.p1 gnl/TRDRNA2_/TRDRNA2_160012_c1~~gnl/TRDRNA2_/TRDRNA2_160012_c1_seq1.p1  ORF type:complete len:337 (-),score=69.26 gnl/TRDRNA2_/TRDRNA2_160012_c1_seq1:6-1016(-)
MSKLAAHRLLETTKSHGPTVHAAATATLWSRRSSAAVAATAVAAAAFQAQAEEQLNPDDLLVIGAGVLGQRVAAMWRAERPGGTVTAVTRSDASHDALRAAGLVPMTIADLTASAPRFDNVLFAAPPSGTPEPGAYGEAVAAALERWAGATGDGDGSFVFTSSASVFAEDAGGVVKESSQLAETAGALRLIDAEELVIDKGGTVLRFAGLYDIDRGPHTYWLKTGVVKGPPDGLINMLHYDDAAAAALAALKQTSRGEVMVVADGSPVSRKGICEAALASKRYAGSAAPHFEAAESGAPAPMGGAGTGKVLDASKARNVLGWKPRYPSFASFMNDH